MAVPPSYSEYADFAAQAVAGLKESSNPLIDELGLKRSERQKWSPEDKERFYSLAFRQGVEHLIDAIDGVRPWPGERGEAKNYWEKVERNTQKIVAENRISVYEGCLVFDARDIDDYVDPRCWLKASERQGLKPEHPVTLTIRKKNDQFGYILGSVPFHPDLDEWDFTKIFPILTLVEKTYGNPLTEGWTGRRTVGGSGWNTESHLTPHTVLDFVLTVGLLSKLGEVQASLE